MSQQYSCFSARSTTAQKIDHMMSFRLSVIYEHFDTDVERINEKLENEVTCLNDSRNECPLQYLKKKARKKLALSVNNKQVIKNTLFFLTDK